MPQDPYSDIAVPLTQVDPYASLAQSGNVSLGKTEIKGDSPMQQLKRRFLSLFPAAGMFLGGAVSAPLGPEAVPLGAAVGGGAGEAARQLLEGGADTSQQAAKDIVTQMEVGAASELGGKAIEELSPILRNSAEKQMTDVLAPTKVVNKLKAQEVAPGLVKRKVTAGTRQGMESRLADETEAAGQEVGEAEENILSRQSANPLTAGSPDQRVSADDLMKSLQAYRSEMAVPGTGGRVTGNDAGASAIDAQIDKLNQLVQNQGNKLSPESVIGLRRALDKQVVASSKGAYVADEGVAAMTDAKRYFANAIRRELSQSYPDLAKVNAEYHFWRTALDVMHDTNVRKLGQSGVVGQMKNLAKSAAAGGIAGHYLGATGGTEAALAMQALSQATQTTAWRTVAASTKGAIADALVNANFQKAMTLIGEIAGSESTLPKNRQDAIDRYQAIQ